MWGQFLVMVLGGFAGYHYWQFITKDKNYSTLIRKGGGVLIGAFTFGVLAALIVPKDSENLEQTQQVVEVAPVNKIDHEKTEPVKQKEASLNVTLEQYKSQFNDAALAANAEFEIKDFEVKAGEVFNTANAKLNDNSFLIVTVGKDGVANGVTTISAGDGTMQSGMHMLFISMVTLRSLNNTLTAQDANKIAMELMKSAVDKGDGKSISKTIDGIKYYAMFSQQLGYWFGAEPAKM